MSDWYRNPFSGDMNNSQNGIPFHYGANGVDELFNAFPLYPGEENSGGMCFASSINPSVNNSSGESEVSQRQVIR